MLLTVATRGSKYLEYRAIIAVFLKNRYFSRSSDNLLAQRAIGSKFRGGTRAGNGIAPRRLLKTRAHWDYYRLAPNAPIIPSRLKVPPTSVCPVP